MEWSTWNDANVYLECHLWSKNEFVSLKKSATGVEEDAVRDAVQQRANAHAHVAVGGASLHRYVEHASECLLKTCQMDDIYCNIINAIF